MKTRDRNLLILVIILVSCFAALFILLSSKDSKQNIWFKNGEVSRTGTAIFFSRCFL